MSLPHDLEDQNEELIYLQLKYGKSHPNLIDKRFTQEEREDSWAALEDGGYASEKYVETSRRTEGQNKLVSGSHHRTNHMKGMDLLRELTKEWKNTEL